MPLDIAVSILLTFLAAQVCSTYAEWYHFAFAIACGLLPDLDALLELYRTKKVAAHAQNPKDHRDGIHYPLFVLPLGYMIVHLASGTFWALLFLLPCSFHFIHDSVGLGWGVKWIFPISNHSFKFFADKHNKTSKQFLVHWGPMELKKAITLYGDKDWLRKYLTSRMFYSECAVCLLTVGLMVNYLYF